MPPTTRIRLRIEERQAATPCYYRELSDPPTTSRLVPLLRLTTLARVEPRGGGPGTRPRRALIDTGAWITAIETDTWRAFDQAGLIEHLPFVPGSLPTPALIGGHTSNYQLGRLWIALVEVRLTGVFWLSALPVVAQLLLDPACKLPSPLLLGLHLSVLDGRKLTRRVVPSAPSSLTTDRGSQFGQDWHLETP